jgi:HlyD family secretion protein
MTAARAKKTLAGEAIMLIVPEGDNLVVEAKISRTDIEQVHIGQTAILRLRSCQCVR